MQDVISTRKFEQDGFTVVVERVVDYDGDASWLEDSNRYEGCTAGETAKYLEQDAERLAGLRRGDWYFVGVAVKILKQTSSNWANGGLEVGRASVWGIESDSDDASFDETERDIIAEAFAEVDELRKALTAETV